MDYALVQSKGQVWRPFFLNFGALPTYCPPKIWLLSSLCATWSKPIIPHPYPLFGACTGTEFGVATVLLGVALTRIDFHTGTDQYYFVSRLRYLWTIFVKYLQNGCDITRNNIYSCFDRYPLCSGYTFFSYHFPPFTSGSTTVQTKLMGEAY